MVFTPTYYGVSSDVRGLADVAHAHDVPLITDDAWGLKARRPNRLVAAVAGVELTQSTSASPLLLSSIDAARRQFQEYGEELLGHAIDLAHRVRDAVAELPGLELMGDEVLDSPGANALDPMHLIDVAGLGPTGFQAADWLHQQHGIFPELADHRRVMALLTFADTDATAQRLVNAMTERPSSMPTRTPVH